MAGRVMYTGGIVTNGLVLNLDAGKLDSYPRSGTTWRDISNNQFTGSLLNGPMFNNTNAGSIIFDGIDDYVTLGNNVAPLFSSNSITVSCFARISAVVSKNTLISFNGQYNFFLPGNRLTTTYQLYWDTLSGWKSGNKSDWNTNQWYHFAWTIRGTTLIFYVNGVSNGNGVLSTTFSPSVETKVGFANAGEYAKGDIANLHVYNRTLSATEVSQNFNALRGRYGI